MLELSSLYLLKVVVEKIFLVTFCFVILTVRQGIYSRTNKFDGNLFQILTVDDVAKQLKPPGLWLNIQVCETIFLGLLLTSFWHILYLNFNILP